MKDVGELSELNLKAGDVVEHVSGSYRPDLWIGVKWTVRNDNGVLRVFTPGDQARNSVPYCTWIYRIVSRATPGPVRTVTRKEIVPGWYGNVRVYENGAVDIDGAISGADELRAAIATLTQIADALEDK